ncbi:hypothetical protein PF005_g4781 [Phytophthora fragariae]|nr:hypothetical protein PF003_g2345 [Phytophthora fragariae]KAE9045899.1 hypothetical protein PR002_g1978 [Phytophthora rubi]KAE8945222.1 hypothetical protein PF009_g5105 [Phytophthora fragariae]KAE9023760.1 hypothetical protein PF011_g3825 [Phytophthora fragariae]KAE9123659.1 hypothetical protein PF007_g6970 [Phytophthora fragariae]
MAEYALKSGEQHFASAHLFKKNQTLLQKLVVQNQTVSQQVKGELSKFNSRMDRITAEVLQMKNEVLRWRTSTL